ncbi:flagellar hook-associated protein FlgK [Aquibacillus sp. 3ASR75-11]|uniref:Flagellar hook-associated protein 1 n=1 Tax=Terrihalobacillus insolitus TaxID=2950438 RepID=A0A9X3WRR8_9BACI|nr:flagellar hook-associated protein FlgK [Terrihalobacillus insolitus]MDC3412225.1 flagellar hook-associated protein FlgK [Terrihalobacillus insolitus]MDC3423081.1 flagellar hook-associated protein FlgK [Terrihalobacillus insolitus]
MGSTFSGLEVAKRALNTQQSALYTTGQNIANANTDGYTRQRVNFEQTAPYPPASRNRPEIAGQVGSGVQAGSIERVRDQFLDLQFRGENSKLGYYESKADALNQMEEIMNEPSEQGLSKTMDRFWQALQDLSVNPEDSGTRSVVRQRGLAVAETFEYLSSSLESIRGNLQNETNVTVKEMNSLLTQINNVNKQIGKIEPNGYLPNDLYDERDRLVDQLSGIVNIKVSYSQTSEQSNAAATAKGQATIEMVNGEGKSYNPPVKLVDGVVGEARFVEVRYDDTLGRNVISELSIGGTTFTGADFSSKGKLQGLVESYGYVDNSEIAGKYPDMLGDLDKMAFEFANTFNQAHKAGYDLEGNPGQDFFKVNGGELGAATRLDVTEAIKENGDLIAASQDGTSGNGNNAQSLAEVMRTPIQNLGNNTSVKSFYESVIGEMAVLSQEARRLQDNSNVLTNQVDERRQSVSSVSLDEEMTNMIKFQQAYNAAARNMTAIDEMLDRIINNMGLVGR